MSADLSELWTFLHGAYAGDGWAPSGIMYGGEMMSGVAALARLKK